VTRKILIAEDEEDIVELLCAIFDDIEDCETFCARDGEEALSIARVNNPDIILLDIQLPRLNGYEICKLVKSDPAMAQTKVLMLSGMVQNSDRLKAYEAGADDYITKPFSSTELVEKVEKLLRNNQWSNGATEFRRFS
jgi:two-component system alkaline phosphatase synthesis response regulator PhoP